MTCLCVADLLKYRTSHIASQYEDFSFVARSLSLDCVVLDRLM